MKKSGKNALINALYIFGLTGLAVAVWAAASAAVRSEFILPSIGQTFDSLKRLLCEKSFWIGLSGTLARSVIAFGISVGLCLLAFWLASSFGGVRRALALLISGLRTLPTMAVALVFAIWAGGYAAPVILGVTVIFPQMYSAVTAAVKSTPKELDDVCKLLGVTGNKKFAALYMPHVAGSLPEIVSSGLSFCIKIVIAAEILTQTAASLGMLMQLSSAYLRIGDLLALTVAAVVVSVALEFITRVILSALLKKYGDANADT